MTRVLSDAMNAAIQSIAQRMPEPKTEHPLLTMIQQMESMADEVYGRAAFAETTANEAKLAALRMKEELKVRRELVEDDLGLSAKCTLCDSRFVRDEPGQIACLNCDEDEHEEGGIGA